MFLKFIAVAMATLPTKAIFLFMAVSKGKSNNML